MKEEITKANTCNNAETKIGKVKMSVKSMTEPAHLSVHHISVRHLYSMNVSDSQVLVVQLQAPAVEDSHRLHHDQVTYQPHVCWPMANLSSLRLVNTLHQCTNALCITLCCKLIKNMDKNF